MDGRRQKSSEDDAIRVETTVEVEVEKKDVRKGTEALELQIREDGRDESTESLVKNVEKIT